MLRTPLKSSKNVYVNKPFKSPFESPAQREESCKKARQNSDATQSPLSTRNKEAKRILLLDDNEKEKKRRKLSENKDPKLSKSNENQKLPESNEDQKLTEKKKDQDLKDLKESNDDTDIEKIVEEASKNDLQALKRRIFELRQELDCLKSKERCLIKHNPDDLKVSIKKWREACQNSLETLCSELAERNGQSYKISDVLKQLNIPETIVHYSEKDDSFI